MLKKILISFPIIVLTILLLLPVIKGAPSSNGLYYQNELDTIRGGPFESSNSNSRFALTKSVVENKSLFLTEDLAKFSSPDLVEYKGKFTIIFTPGVPFLAVPLYIVGMYFNSPQLFAYLTTTLIALLNIFLVYQLARKIGANLFGGILSGLAFGFATPALAYSNTLTQHHYSVAVILMALLLAAGKKTLTKNILIGIMFGLGILIDIPNIFLMFPIGLYLLKEHFSIKEIKSKIQVAFRPALFAILVGLLPLIIFFGWYNYQTTGSYTTLGQTIGRTNSFATAEIKKIEDINKLKKDEYQTNVPFQTRLQLNGLYILLISNERGLFYFSPILLIGILGLIVAWKNVKQKALLLLILSIISVNVVLYSMFPDPWGGWSFGARYLIPTMALLSIGVGLALQKIGNPFFLILVPIILFYSTYISVLGAITTNAIPPKVEAVNLPVPSAYSFDLNMQLADKNQSSSLLYNLILNKYLSLNVFIYTYVLIVITLLMSLYLQIIIRKEENERV